MKPALNLALLSLIGLAACAKHDTQMLNGYVEAEPVRVSSPVAGRLLSYSAEKGDQVKAGQALFVLDPSIEHDAVDGAQARVQQASAEAADLATGKRPDEIAAATASLHTAQASLRVSESNLQRQTILADKGFISRASLDAFVAQRDADAALVAQMAAQVRVAQLAGREQTRAAAQANTRAAQADLAQKQWALDQKSVTAPITARVEDRFYRIGEWVPAGAPVYALLSPDAVKVRFFVPETRLSQVSPGAPITVQCDGCAHTIPAIVRFVATQAEFTPPVIYSKENRDKLVYLVEAFPQLPDGERLRPGQPVDVKLAAAK